MRIAVESRLSLSPRAQQAASLFDLEIGSFSRLVWDVDLPLAEKPWNIGLIAGPSGAGKSTIARHLFPRPATGRPGSVVWSDLLPPWPNEGSVLDGFPESMPVRDVTGLLSSVGFSSPPAWLRPHRVLSTGEQFRANLARLLAMGDDGRTLVCDEYTSVVDRTVARVGSSAVAKAVRARGLEFVAVTCHEDVIDWLQPDWLYRVDANSFVWRSLQRRPVIELELVRGTAAAWPLFARHHYLNDAINASAICFLAFARLGGEEAKVAAFSAWLPSLGSGRPAKREHRTVVLPDYQGVGVGMAVSSTIAAAWLAMGFDVRSTTTHPAYVAARRRSPLWEMIRPPGLVPTKNDSMGGHRIKHATTRLTAGFIYKGPPLDAAAAAKLCA